MPKKPFKKLSIRDAVVRDSSTGYILASDPKLEQVEKSHTKFFEWDDGTLTSGSLNFNAHSCCLVSDPELALVMMAEVGDYGITTPEQTFAGNVFKGQPKRKEYGMFNMVTTIAGKAYAVGLRGMVYRLDKIKKWVPMDQGLPGSFDISAIDGFDDSDIYAIGRKGALWRFNNNQWTSIELPTNVNLTAIKCAGDGNIYIGGYNGLLVCGHGNEWKIINKKVSESIWDLEWFEGNLYVSTISFVYLLTSRALSLVDFGDDPPETCYHLSMAEGVMWSIGARDVMSFDGKKWTRII